LDKEHIFEKLNKSFDLNIEIRRIEALFCTKLYYEQFGSYRRIWYFPEQLVDEYCIFSWEHRKNCITCRDMRETLGIPHFDYVDCYTQDEVLTYLEYVANILFLCEIWRKSHSDLKVTDEYDMLIQNLNVVLDTLNLEIKCFEESRQVFIKEKNNAINIVLDSVDDNIAIDIVKYNHHMLKGKLEEKRKILAFLATEFEGMRKQLKSMKCNIEDDAGYLLNTFIRHNNNSKMYIQSLLNDELERWYDKTYELVMICFLQNKYLQDKKDIKSLKQRMSENTKN